VPANRHKKLQRKQAKKKKRKKKKKKRSYKAQAIYSMVPFQPIGP
jgi:hypothetical protein